MGVSIPDSSILMRGLSRLMKKLLSTHQELNFRLSLVRNALLVDMVPSLESVTKYSEHLLAQLEQMGHCKQRGRRCPQKLQRSRSLRREAKEKRDPEWGSRTEKWNSKKKPCRFFLTDQHGCKRGKGCRFGHVLDGEKRCWPCGSKDHMANNCKRGSGEAEESKVKAAKASSKGAGEGVLSRRLRHLLLIHLRISLKLRMEVRTL